MNAPSTQQFVSYQHYTGWYSLLFPWQHFIFYDLESDMYIKLYAERTAAFLRQKMLRERVTMLRYTYIAFLV